MFKKLILSFIRRFDYDIVKTTNQFWYDPFPYDDIKQLFDSNNIDRPILFDVGANQGQTIDIFQLYFPTGTIHAFEPGITSYNLINKKYASPSVTINQAAVSSQEGVATFFDYPQSDLSSLSKLDTKGNSDETIAPTTYEVPTLALDQYCANSNVDVIHLLKTDTQGHEIDVLKGFQKTLKEHKVFLIFIEMNFQSQYENEAHYLTIWNRLVDQGFELFRLYHARYDSEGKILWADALFVSSEFSKR